MERTIPFLSVFLLVAIFIGGCLAANGCAAHAMTPEDSGTEMARLNTQNANEIESEIILPDTPDSYFSGVTLCQSYAVPGDGGLGDGTPGDGAPGDGVLGDDAPGDGVLGDDAPGDGVLGDGTASDSEQYTGGERDTVPRPSSVVRKSMIVPGWGQVVNRQAWKVPVIYGLFGGLGYYTYTMDRNYQDYRAAYYNSQYPDGDERFGPTPPHIDPSANPDLLRHNRNVYRNRRDLTLVGILLAYGLNLVDAYVFAHMRDFDVSDDLSANISVQPAWRAFQGPAALANGRVADWPAGQVWPGPSPGVTIRLTLR